VPAQDRARGDQAMAPQDRRQPPDEVGEDRSVGPVQAWVGLVRRSTATSWCSTRSSTSLEDAAQQHHEAEHLQEDQMQQPQRHGGDPPGP
jgi:hypothetical protein